MQHKAGYREDVQGLRAIAVLAVILFHIDHNFLPGGYIGVDVFFVISGYVISRSIRRSMEEGSFSIWQFFYARLRRLYPAALVTIAVCLLIGAFIFPPSPMMQLAKSAVFSIVPVSLANFYFMMDAGYWSADSITKPLLHMWSLAVEDQFYLVWPLVAVLLFRATWRGALIGIASIVFFGAIVSEIGVRWAPTGAFFMTPFRIFEFAIGAALVLTEGRYRLRSNAHEAVIALSYVVLLAYFILYDGSRPFPGFAALPPLLAAAALIQFGASPIFGRLIVSRAASFLGGISYSLYLVHWPVIVFYVYWVFRTPSATEKVGLFLFTLLAGVALHYGVERRYRNYDFVGNIRTTSVGSALSALVALVAGLFWVDGGMAARSSQYISVQTLDAGISKRYTDVLAICRQRGWDRCNSDSDVPQGAKRVLIVGDSHGTDGLNFAGAALGDAYLILNGLAACPPVTLDSKWWSRPGPTDQKCREKNEKRNARDYLNRFNILVVSARLGLYGPDDLGDYIRHARIMNPEMKIIVLGAYYYLNIYCVDIIQRDQDKDCTKSKYVERKFSSNEQLRQITESVGGLFIDKSEMCDGDKCPTFVSGAPFSWDSHHLSYEFARKLGEKEAAVVRDFVAGP
jgi:peptidoglycan/LPS O-acetylase OafA/YrhL